MANSSRRVAASRFALSTPWYYGWNIVAITVLFQAVTLGLMIYGFSFWIAPLRDEFGVSTAAVLAAATLSHLAMSAYSPFVGPKMDSLTIRLISTVGVAIFCAGYFLISLTTDLWQVLVIYATLLPLGATLAGVLGAQIATTRWFEKRRGTALGVSAIGSSLGGFVFPPVVALLNESLGWRPAHMLIAAAVTAIILPIILVFVRERRDGEIEPGSDRQPASSATQLSAQPAWTTGEILRNKTLWILAASLLPPMFVFVGTQFNTAPIAEEAGIAAQSAAYLMSAVAIAMILGKLFFGSMSDRLDQRLLVSLIAVVLMLSQLLLFLGSSYTVTLLGFAALGFAAGGFTPLMGAIVASRYGAANFGRVAGLLGPLLAVAGFAPTVIGYLHTGFDSYAPIFQIMLVVLLPAIIAACFLGPLKLERPPGHCPS